MIPPNHSLSTVSVNEFWENFNKGSMHSYPTAKLMWSLFRNCQIVSVNHFQSQDSVYLKLLCYVKIENSLWLGNTQPHIIKSGCDCEDSSCQWIQKGVGEGMHASKGWARVCSSFVGINMDLFQATTILLGCLWVLVKVKFCWCFVSTECWIPKKTCVETSDFKLCICF